MSDRTCRQHRRRNCSTCTQAQRSSGADDAAIWSTVYGSSDYGSSSYDGGSSSSSSDSGGGCGGGGGD